MGHRGLLTTAFTAGRRFTFCCAATARGHRHLFPRTFLSYRRPRRHDACTRHRTRRTGFVTLLRARRGVHRRASAHHGALLSSQVRAAPVSSHFSELAAVLSGVQLVAFAAPRQASGEMISPREMRLASGETSGNATGGAHHSVSGGAHQPVVSGGAHQPVSWFVQHGLLNATYLDIEHYLPAGK